MAIFMLAFLLSKKDFHENVVAGYALGAQNFDNVNDHGAVTAEVYFFIVYYVLVCQAVSDPFAGTAAIGARYAGKVPPGLVMGRMVSLFRQPDSVEDSIIKTRECLGIRM